MMSLEIFRCLFGANYLERVPFIGRVGEQDVYFEDNIPMAEWDAIVHPEQKAGFFGFKQKMEDIQLPEYAESAADAEIVSVILPLSQHPLYSRRQLAELAPIHRKPPFRPSIANQKGLIKIYN